MTVATSGDSANPWKSVPSYATVSATFRVRGSRSTSESLPARSAPQALQVDERSETPPFAQRRAAERAQTSSMRAISALSPWRVPSFRIRV